LWAGIVAEARGGWCGNQSNGKAVVSS
jgi:hypothetical protein